MPIKITLDCESRQNQHGIKASSSTTKHVQQFGYERMVMAEGSWDLYFYPAFSRSALDSIHQNHLGREGLRWNDGQLSVILNENY